MLNVTVSNIIGHTVSVFDADKPSGTGENFLGVIDYNEDTGLIGWFNPDNPLDPWSLCQALMGAGFAVRTAYGPGFYGHVDYFVTPRFRRVLAEEAAESEYHGQQAAAEIAAETAIPQHLVW